MTKGRDAERLVADRLEDCGYEAWQPPKAKYREQDLFGLFDLAAVGHGTLYLIQVKGGQRAAGIRSWFHDARRFEEELGDVRVAFVHVADNDDCRVAVPGPDGYTWEVDERLNNPLTVESYFGVPDPEGADDE